MEKVKKFTIESNTCIISTYLLDELDYIVGGYGEPTIESLFNLNAFIESYILSSNFMITTQELDHTRITRKVLFPNGRPILDLITIPHKFYIVNGFGNPLMKCVFVEKTPDKTHDTVSKYIDEFTSRDSKLIKDTFILSDVTKTIESVKTFSIGFQENSMIIGETSNKPFEIVKSFYDKITNLNVQSALPIFTYKQQFNELRKKAISKDIYKTICEIQGQEIKDAENYIGGELQALPPLLNIVLDRAKNREQIPQILKELRDDFTEFRNCCENFEKNLNEAKTIREQVEAIKDYKAFWAILVKKYTDKTTRILFRFIDLAKESDYESSLDGVIDSQSASDILKDLNLGKVAGKAGLFAWDKIKEKRVLNKFKGVTDLWSLVNDSPSFEHQIKNAERVFKTQIDRNKISATKDFLNAIEKTSFDKVLPKRE